MRRPFASLLLTLTLTLAFAVAVAVAGVGVGVVTGAGPASAADDTTTSEPIPTDDIIPEPNSGSEPEDAGDRGGALQTALFVAIVVVVGATGAYLVVQSRKARAERGF